MSGTPTLDEERSDAPAKPKPRPLLRGWLHVGAAAAVLIAGPLLIVQASSVGSTVVLIIYVVSLLLLFGISALFHRKQWSPPARLRMRRADHAAIFVAIAGTYTAVAGLALEGWARLFVLIFVWVGALAGVAVRQVWLQAPKWAIALPAVVVGWFALAVLPELLHGLGGAGFTLVLLGGVFYTAGAAAYALRWPDLAPNVFGYHEVFHSCTVIGATLQYVALSVYAVHRV
jgi:hemolysin III